MNRPIEAADPAEAAARTRRRLGPWAGFFSLAVAALAVNLAYHGPW